MDESSTFAGHCNPGMVKLGPVEGEDEEVLKGLVQKHYDLTESTVAKRVIEAWDEVLAKFVRVMPVDYARVLEERKRAAQQAEERVSA